MEVKEHKQAFFHGFIYDFGQCAANPSAGFNNGAVPKAVFIDTDGDVQVPFYNLSNAMDVDYRIVFMKIS